RLGRTPSSVARGVDRSRPARARSRRSQSAALTWAPTPSSRPEHRLILRARLRGDAASATPNDTIRASATPSGPDPRLRYAARVTSIDELIDRAQAGLDDVGLLAEDVADEWTFVTELVAAQGRRFGAIAA